MQTQAERAARLQRAQEDLQLDDEHATGGQQANELLDIVRQRKRGKKENAAPEAQQPQVASSAAKTSLHSGYPGALSLLALWQNNQEQCIALAARTSMHWLHCSAT